MSDEATPLYVEQIPCVDDYGDQPHVARGSGTCYRCRQKVAVQPGTENASSLKWVAGLAVPHTRRAEAYLLQDVVSCSCGGWHGTPVGPERRDNGSEVLLLSFQQRVDDIDHNVENAVNLLLEMKEQLDRLTGDDQ